MSKHEKTLQRLFEKPTPADIRWKDLQGALEYLGYKMLPNKGSRRKFVHAVTKHVISLHEPHPQPEVKQYAIKDVANALCDAGVMERKEDGTA